MNHVPATYYLEEEALPVQDFLFDSKKLLVADQLFYKIGLDMKINPFSEVYLHAFKKKTIVMVKNFDGIDEPKLEITFLTLNPKQFHNIKTALKKPFSENFFETEVTRVSFIRDGIDDEGNIIKENPFTSWRGDVTQRNIIIKITKTNKKEIESFSALLGLEIMRKAVRGALYNKDLVAYAGIVGNSRDSLWKIGNHEWADDGHWHRFLADGHINVGYRNDFSGRVFFNKLEIDEWIFINQMKSYDLHSSWVEVLPHQYPLSNRAILPSPKVVKELESPAVEKRGALRLLTLCQRELEKRGQSSFEKKHVLVDAIQELADNNGFEVTDDVQKRLSCLSDEEKDQLDKKAVSREDVKAIATLLRSLKQQGGTFFKKSGN